MRKTAALQISRQMRKGGASKLVVKCEKGDAVQVKALQIIEPPTFFVGLFLKLFATFHVP